MQQQQQPELKHTSQSRPTELRYRIADFINDRLRVFPAFHSAAKAALAFLVHPRNVANQAGVEAARQSVSDPNLQAHAHGSPVALRNKIPVAEIAPDNLPIPPFEMRQLVGPTEIAAFDNSSCALVYPYLAAEAYESVFDFGCGCGRVARQLIQQRPRPKRYVGVDLHAGMVRWCQRNLQPACPGFSFFHHDVQNVNFNPKPGSPTVAPLPVGDGEFSLVNALSVFTHLTEEQALHYLLECTRILRPEGILHASWFLFDKREFPMLRPEANALYISYVDPSGGVLFDRDWVRTTARQFGLRICQVIPPYVRGHQWTLVMTRRQDAEEPEFPADTAPYGEAYPPTSARRDLSTIGLEAE